MLPVSLRPASSLRQLAMAAEPRLRVGGLACNIMRVSLCGLFVLLTLPLCARRTWRRERT